MSSKNTHIRATNAKRLMSFIKDIEKNQSEYYEAKPSESDINIWYVKIKNLADEYVGGVYYMKIHFTDQYPFKPPDYYMLTPSGRFEINRAICLSNSGFHSESWSPLWGINQLIMGIISFFYERDSQGIAHISNSSNEDRARYAKQSIEYNRQYLPDIDKMFYTEPKEEPKKDEMIEKLNEELNEKTKKDEPKEKLNDEPKEEQKEEQIKEHNDVLMVKKVKRVYRRRTKQ